MNPIDTLNAGPDGIAEMATGEDPKLFAEVIKLAQTMPDGLSGLIMQFQDRGLGTLVPSLTGKAPKQPITPDQIVQGFGKEKIDEFAASTGLDPQVVPEKLALVLPKVFERLAPQSAITP